MAKSRILPSISPLFVQRERIDQLFHAGNAFKVIYLKAPAGYGKTTAALNWLIDKNFKNVFWLQIRSFDNFTDEFFEHFFVALTNKLGNPKELLNLINIYKSNQYSISIDEWIVKFSLQLEEKDEPFYFMLDDLHLLSGDILKEIYTFIISCPSNYKFIFSSRNKIPMEFSELIVRSQLYVISAKVFNFTFDETKQYFLNCGYDLSDDKIKDIVGYTNGRISAYAAINISLSQEDSTDVDIKDVMSNEYIIEFLKSTLWNPMSPETKKVFSVANLFEDADIIMLQSILNADVRSIFENFFSSTGYVTKEKEDNFILYPEFKELINKVSTLNPLDKKKYYSLAAKYYSSSGNKNKALRLMVDSQNYDDAADLMEILNSSSDEYMNNVISRNLIFSLPNQLIEKRPNLIKIALLESLDNFMIDDAYFWFNKLKRYRSFAINESDIVESESLLTYLTTTLPNRSTKDILEKIPETARLIREGKLRGIRSSFTCAFPSTISGAYHCFIDIDNYMLNTFLKEEDVRSVLPKYGNYLLKAGRAEIMYEHFKLNDSINILLELIKNHINELCNDLVFAVRTVLVKCLICQGKKEVALRELSKIKDFLDENGLVRMFRNFKDFSLKVSVVRNEKALVYEWYEGAMDESKPFNAFNLTHFVSKAWAYIYLKEYYKALKLCDILIEKYSLFNNYLYLTEIKLIKASAYHYLNDPTPRNDVIRDALVYGVKYNLRAIFIALGPIISDAIYAFSKEKGLNPIERSFINFIVDEQRRLVSFYSKLNVDLVDEQLIHLTKTELTIINLIEEGFSNKDICDQLSIKEPTVKTHISNILSKLGVKNRTQAVKVAKENKII